MALTADADADARLVGRGAVASQRVLGFKLTVFTEDDLIDFVLSESGGRRGVVVASLNMHGLYMYITDPQVRALHDRPQTFQRIDGMPIVWFGTFGGIPLRLRNRVPWNDLIWPLLNEAARRGRRVFYLGSKPEIVARAFSMIRAACPGIQIDGRHGYFDATPGSHDNRTVVEAINAYKPDLLIVGMGMPRQERWIAAHLADLDVPVVMTAGAAMEVLTGALPKPPAWVSRSGLEGPYRLLYSPRRTWRRYLLEPWTVLTYILRNHPLLTGRRSDDP